MNSRLHRWKNFLVVYGPAAVILLAGFYYAQRFIQPAPPHSLTIAAGQPGGTYRAFAVRYAAFLKNEGIDLQIRQTAGSMENISLLRNGSVDLAFVQGGTLPSSGIGHIEALGSLFFEPLWLFHRKNLTLDRITGLEHLRVSIGPPGSGTAVLVEKLEQLDVDGRQLEQSFAAALRERLIRLDRMDEDALGLKVPAGLSDRLYQLREHIALVRANLESALRSKQMDT